MLAFGTEDWDYQNLKRGEIRIYDTASRKLVRTIRNINIPIYSMQFGNDGQEILGLGSDPYTADLRPAGSGLVPRGRTVGGPRSAPVPARAQICVVTALRDTDSH